MRLRCSRCGGALYTETLTTLDGNVRDVICLACGERTSEYLRGGLDVQPPTSPTDLRAASSYRHPPATAEEASQ